MCQMQALLSLSDDHVHHTTFAFGTQHTSDPQGTRTRSQSLTTWLCWWKSFLIFLSSGVCRFSSLSACWVLFPCSLSVTFFLKSSFCDEHLDPGRVPHRDAANRRACSDSVAVGSRGWSNRSRLRRGYRLGGGRKQCCLRHFFSSVPQRLGVNTLPKHRHQATNIRHTTITVTRLALPLTIYLVKEDHALVNPRPTIHRRALMVGS